MTLKGKEGDESIRPHVLSDGGVAYAIDGDISIFDSKLHKTRTIKTDNAELVAVGPDDEIYAFLKPLNQLGGQIVALTSTGQEQWRQSLASNLGLYRLAVGLDGLYVGAEGGDGAAILKFEPMTGASRAIANKQRLLAAHDGVFTASLAPIPPPEVYFSQALRHLDREGNETWIQVLLPGGLDPMQGGVDVREGFPTPDGGIVVPGKRLRDPITGLDANFVLKFDADGSYHWVSSDGLKVGGVLSQSSLLVSKSEINVGATCSHDVVVGVASSDELNGVVDAKLKITGSGRHDVLFASPMSDGTALVEVASQPPFSSTPACEEPLMAVGDRTFTAPGIYVFKVML